MWTCSEAASHRLQNIGGVSNFERFSPLADHDQGWGLKMGIAPKPKTLVGRRKRDGSSAPISLRTFLLQSGQENGFRRLEIDSIEFSNLKDDRLDSITAENLSSPQRQKVKARPDMLYALRSEMSLDAEKGSITMYETNV